MFNKKIDPKPNIKTNNQLTDNFMLYKLNNLEKQDIKKLNNWQLEQLKVYQNMLIKPLNYMGILINTSI